MWTDSTTVLQRLHSFEKQSLSEAIRVVEIVELTIVDEWNHVPTAEKPTDADTRRLPAASLC